MPMPRAILVMLLILPTQSWSVDTFVGGLYEFQHVEGVTGLMVEPRFRNGWALHGAGFSERNYVALGGLYRWEGAWVVPGIGAVYIDETNLVNGTHGNFVLALDTQSLRLGRLRCAAGWRHYSNGKCIFGWADGRPNVGWNFVTLGCVYP